MGICTFAACGGNRRITAEFEQRETLDKGVGRALITGTFFWLVLTLLHIVLAYARGRKFGWETLLMADWRERRRAITLTIAVAVVLAVGLGWPTQAQAQCEPVDIALDTTVMGALEVGDCTIALLGIDPSDASFVDVYRVTLAAAGFLSVDLQSQLLQFDALLGIFDESLTTLLFIDDESGDDSNSFIDRVPLAAGTYIILASSFFEGDTGAYDLSTSLDATGNPACDVVVDLPPTAIANGTLSAGDCTAAQLDLDAGGSFADQYRVALPAGGALTIALDSVAFDSYLYVLDETLTNLIAFDDDSGGSSNALLSDLSLDPGTYVIVANSFSVGETGAYTLTLIPEPSAGLLSMGALLTLGALARRRKGRWATVGRG